MSGLDIEAIRERSLLAERLPSGLREHAGRNVTALSDSAADVPVLLAEIERLNAELQAAREAEFEVVRLRGERAGALANLREQAAEMKRMHVEAELLVRHCEEQSEHDRVQREEVVAELAACRGALADALQVIADLRGETT